MKIVLNNQGNTLGSILRHNLEKVANDEFVTCTVEKPMDTFLIVHSPDISTLRKALLECQTEINSLKTYLQRFNTNKNKQIKIT